MKVDCVIIMNYCTTANVMRLIIQLLVNNITERVSWHPITTHKMGLSYTRISTRPLSLSLFSSLIGLIFLYASNDFLDPAGRERGVIWHQELAGFFYTDNDDDDFLFHFFPPFHSLSRESHDFNRQTKKGKYTMTTTCTWKISSQCQLRPPSLSSGAWLAWAVPALSSSLSTAKIRLRGSTNERDWDPTPHFYCWKEDKHHELNGRIFFFILLLKRLVKVKWKRLLDYDSDQMIACI